MRQTDEEQIVHIDVQAPADTCVGFRVRWKHDASSICFEAGPNIRPALANKLLLADGRTCGQAAEDELHARLQNWIDQHKEQQNAENVR